MYSVHMHAYEISAMSNQLTAQIVPAHARVGVFRACWGASCAQLVDSVCECVCMHASFIHDRTVTPLPPTKGNTHRVCVFVSVSVDDARTPVERDTSPRRNFFAESVCVCECAQAGSQIYVHIYIRDRDKRQPASIIIIDGVVGVVSPAAAAVATTSVWALSACRELSASASASRARVVHLQRAVRVYTAAVAAVGALTYSRKMGPVGHSQSRCRTRSNSTHTHT